MRVSTAGGYAPWDANDLRHMHLCRERIFVSDARLGRRPNHRAVFKLAIVAAADIGVKMFQVKA
jgi:hypothetical protein